MTIIEHWQIDGGYYRLSEKLLHYKEFENYVNTATKITYKSDEVILEFERYSPKVKNIKIDEKLFDLFYGYNEYSERSYYSNKFYNILMKKKYSISIDYEHKNGTIIESFHRYLERNNLFLFFQDNYVFVSNKNDTSESNTFELIKYTDDNLLKIALGIDFYFYESK